MMKIRIKNSLIIAAAAIIVYLILVFLIYINVIDEYTTQLITLSGIYIIVALSLNLIMGFTGQLALGQAGFMAIGAYATAIALVKWNIPMLLALLIGGLVAALFGIVIGFPALRLRGDYLAITTLGFGEIIKVLIIYLENLTGGSAGFKGIPHFSENVDFLLNSIITFSWVYIFVILIMIMLKNFINSSHGRAIISIREDEVAASAMGINISFYKIMSFTLAAFIAGLGGGLYACYMGYLNSDISSFLNSINIVIIVVLGGLGSITGTVVAGIFFIFSQELLRFFADWRLVIFGFMLIILMRFRPRGLMGNKELSFINTVNNFRWDKYWLKNIKNKFIMMLKIRSKKDRK